MMHRYHPDPARDDDPDAILWPDCPRCEQQAQDPIRTLDADNLDALWQLMRSVELSADGPDYYRNATEARAANSLYELYAIVSNRMGLIGDMITEAITARQRREEARA